MYDLAFWRLILNYKFAIIRHCSLENIPWGVDPHNCATESAHGTSGTLTIIPQHVNIFKYLVYCYAPYLCTGIIAQWPYHKCTTLCLNEEGIRKENMPKNGA